MKRKNLKDLTGKKFGRWLVVNYAFTNKFYQRYWHCKCMCGKYGYITTGTLNSGESKSCGCLQKELVSAYRFKHGMTNKFTYSIWKKIRQRCLSKNDKSYKFYGARGINLCKRWLKFNNFFSDMGIPPIGMSIERIDNNKGYSPKNCKWASRLDQANNTRKNRRITYKNETHTLSEWARKLSINYKSLHNRLNTLNWSVERAFSS